MEQHSGTYTVSGDGVTTTFSFPHGCSFTPYQATAVGISPDTSYDIRLPGSIPYSTTWNSSNIIINYFSGAPQSGINNLTWSWDAKCH